MPHTLPPNNVCGNGTRPAVSDPTSRPMFLRLNQRPSRALLFWVSPFAFAGSRAVSLLVSCFLDQPKRSEPVRFHLTWNRPGGVHWREGDGVAELLERSHEAGGQALLVGALEVIGPEIAIGDTPGEHDVDGGEHGRGLRCGSAVAGGARGAAPAVKPRWVDSNMRAPALAGLGQSGVREGLTGQTRMRARGTKNEPTSGPTSPSRYPSFIRRRSSNARWETYT